MQTAMNYEWVVESTENIRNVCCHIYCRCFPNENKQVVKSVLVITL